MIGVALQHPLDVGSADECHAVADTLGFQLAEGYEFVNILSGTTHEYGCFGKGEILLMLYLHDWPGDFEEVVLLHHSGSLGFRLTSLAAIPLHTASGYKGLAAKLAFLGCFHTALSFTRSLFQLCSSEVVNGCKRQSTVVAFMHDVTIAAYRCGFCRPS